MLARKQESSPETFADLSLAVVKLVGRGEYAVETPGAQGAGHFGLAVREYAHSTAPNRRFPDMVTQRLLKAAIAGVESPYSTDELAAIATHCSLMEEASTKIERQSRKSAQALFMTPRRKEYFDAVVTCANQRGIYVRLSEPPIEGQMVRGTQPVPVGAKIRVRLVRTNVPRGLIDFARAGARPRVDSSKTAFTKGKMPAIA